ncbi:MAG: prepilin-type N-terminal cleavage/methylation domain-containing protein [Longimicrobiales bacterium]|nr:prepilin-type N-terminal cleavage/methylation domain-containing protein [Longimicrobiales bacterium]
MGVCAGSYEPPRGGPRAGFTLIEVVAAFVIFAAGILAAMNLTGSMAGQVEDAGLRSEVVSAAQERIEELERLPYDSLVVDVGTSTQALTLQGRSYTRTTVITLFNPRTVSLEVTVAPGAGDSGPSQTLLSYAYEAW